MSWVICGFYTPDYKRFADPLRKNLERLGVAFDLHETPKLKGGWEVNTRAKAAQIGGALDRHPDKTVIFIDVDCEVRGPVERLDALANIPGDIGLFFRTRLKSNGALLFLPRSGTMVFKQTPAVRELLRQWDSAALSAYHRAHDQDTLTIAMSRVPNLSWTALPNEACAILSDKCADPIILHDSADKGKDAATRFQKKMSARLAALSRKFRLRYTEPNRTSLGAGYSTGRAVASN